MSIFSSSEIKTGHQVQINEIKDYIKEKLNAICKYKIIDDNNNKLSIEGSIKESFTLVTSFTLQFEFIKKDNYWGVNITGDIKPNVKFVIFGVCGIIGCFLNIPLLIGPAIAGCGLYWFQKNHFKKICDGILKALDTKFRINQAESPGVLPPD